MEASLHRRGSDDSDRRGDHRRLLPGAGVTPRIRAFHLAEQAYRRYVTHHNACEDCQAGSVCSVGRILTRMWQDAEDQHRSEAAESEQPSLLAEPNQFRFPGIV